MQKNAKKMQNHAKKMQNHAKKFLEVSIYTFHFARFA